MTNDTPYMTLDLSSSHFPLIYFRHRYNEKHKLPLQMKYLTLVERFYRCLGSLVYLRGGGLSSVGYVLSPPSIRDPLKDTTN